MLGSVLSVSVVVLCVLLGWCSLCVSAQQPYIDSITGCSLSDQSCAIGDVLTITGGNLCSSMVLNAADNSQLLYCQSFTVSDHAVATCTVPTPNAWIDNTVAIMITFTCNDVSSVATEAYYYAAPSISQSTGCASGMQACVVSEVVTLSIDPINGCQPEYIGLQVLSSDASPINMSPIYVEPGSVSFYTPPLDDMFTPGSTVLASVMCTSVVQSTYYTVFSYASGPTIQSVSGCDDNAGPAGTGSTGNCMSGSTITVNIPSLTSFCTIDDGLTVQIMDDIGEMEGMSDAQWIEGGLQFTLPDPMGDLDWGDDVLLAISCASIVDSSQLIGPSFMALSYSDSSNPVSMQANDGFPVWGVSMLAAGGLIVFVVCLSVCIRRRRAASRAAMASRSAMLVSAPPAYHTLPAAGGALSYAGHPTVYVHAVPMPVGVGVPIAGARTAPASASAGYSAYAPYAPSAPSAPHAPPAMYNHPPPSNQPHYAQPLFSSVYPAMH